MQTPSFGMKIELANQLTAIALQQAVTARDCWADQKAKAGRHLKYIWKLNLDGWIPGSKHCLWRRAGIVTYPCGYSLWSLPKRCSTGHDISFGVCLGLQLKWVNNENLLCLSSCSRPLATSHALEDNPTLWINFGDSRISSQKGKPKSHQKFPHGRLVSKPWFSMISYVEPVAAQYKLIPLSNKPSGCPCHFLHHSKDSLIFSVSGTTQKWIL